MNRRLTVLTLAALLAVVPGRASADWLVSPFVGPTFGADSGVLNLGRALGGDESLTYGGSLGFLGPGLLGVEVDVGYSPSFFEGSSFLGLIVDSSVTTVMANAIVGGPRRSSGASMRPYASGGVGLIRSTIADELGIFEVDENALGVNVGGGVMGFFNDQVGIRADVRYFRSVEDAESAGLDFLTRDLSFWRGTVGVAFRF